MFLFHLYSQKETKIISLFWWKVDVLICGDVCVNYYWSCGAEAAFSYFYDPIHQPLDTFCPFSSDLIHTELGVPKLEWLCNWVKEEGGLESTFLLRSGWLVWQQEDGQMFDMRKTTGWERSAHTHTSIKSGTWVFLDLQQLNHVWCKKTVLLTFCHHVEDAADIQMSIILYSKPSCSPVRKETDNSSAQR